MRLQELSKSANGADVAVIRIGKGELKLLCDLAHEAYKKTPKITDTIVLRSDLQNLVKGLGASLKELGYKQPKVKLSRT